MILLTLEILVTRMKSCRWGRKPCQNSFPTFIYLANLHILQFWLEYPEKLFLIFLIPQHIWSTLISLLRTLDLNDLFNALLIHHSELLKSRYLTPYSLHSTWHIEMLNEKLQNEMKEPSWWAGVKRVLWRRGNLGSGVGIRHLVYFFFR